MAMNGTYSIKEKLHCATERTWGIQVDQDKDQNRGKNRNNISKAESSKKTEGLSGKLGN